MDETVAKAYVEFVAMGTQAVLQQAQRLASAISSAFTGVSRIAMQAGAGATGFIYAAGRGSKEMELFGKSIQLVVTSLGQGLAPYIRAATAFMLELAESLQVADGSLLDSIAKWAMIAVAIGAALALAPMVLGVIGAVAGVITALGAAFSAIMGIIGTVMVSISAIGAPVLLLFGGIVISLVAMGQALYRVFGAQTEAAEDSSEAVVNATDHWTSRLAAGLKATVTSFATAWNRISDLVITAIGHMKHFWDSFVDGIVIGIRILQLGMGERGPIEEWKRSQERSQKDWNQMLADIKAASIDPEKINSVIDAAFGKFQGFLKRSGPGGDGKPPIPFNMPERQGPTGFESGQRTWERLVQVNTEQENVQKTIAEQITRTREELEKLNTKADAGVDALDGVVVDKNHWGGGGSF